MRSLGVVLALVLFSLTGFNEASSGPSAPRLTNNPVMDVIVTSSTPMLSFFNASGGTGKRTYDIQLDKVPTFDSSALVTYRDVAEYDPFITCKRVEKNDALEDKALYYWRVRATDSNGSEGPWAWSRFFVDTKSDDSFMNLERLAIAEIEVSSGRNAKNIIDIDDPGQSTFWQATPPGHRQHWVKFGLGRRSRVSRIWLLSNPSIPQIVGPKLTKPDISDSNGWLKDFVWQMSDDGEHWMEIPGTRITGNDTYRNIINFQPVTCRYVRLLITDWYGYAPHINAAVLYSPGKPPVPESPSSNYVLIVGNQQSGFTFTELKRFVEGLNLDLKALVVPHYEVSMEMLRSLDRKPVAIILSGNNASYANMPMFEYNGEFEIIRNGTIPILGICCGHQLLHMAYGYTNVRAMGWSDFTCTYLKPPTPIKIVKEDPIFQGMASRFTAPEVHSWAVVPLTQHYEVIGESGYIQMVRAKGKLIYGEQFHPEIRADYNKAQPSVVNFLEMAIEKATGRRLFR